MAQAKEKPKLNRTWLVILAAVGIALMLIPSVLSLNEEKEEQNVKSETVYYSEILEEKLTELISSASGVGKARVVVTLDTSKESVLAQNEKTSDGTSAVEYVIINSGSGEEPVPVSEIYPKVRGVAVVCTGGENAEVKKRVTELIAAALGISANKIAVSG